jgi:hypothetical protein
LLQERGYETHTLAPDIDYLDSAREFCDDHIHLGTPTALPFPDASFDGVLGLGSLEYLSEDDLTQSLRELRRVVKECLFLAIQTHPDPEDRWQPPPRDCHWWKARLEGAGFEQLAPDSRDSETETLLRTTGIMACAFRKTVSAAWGFAPPIQRSWVGRFGKWFQRSSRAA